MAVLRQLIFAAVTGDATITALIAARCYPDLLPEDATLPAVTYSAYVSDDDSDYRTHDQVPVPRAVARSQFNCYAVTGDDADELARAVIALWTGYKDACNIGYAQVVNRIDTREPAINRFRYIVDVRIEHER